MSSDHFSVRVVVVGLIGVLLVLSAGMLYLATTQTDIPDSVDRLAFLVAGAVSGLLAKTSTSNEAQDVNVVNEPEQPLPVEEVAEGRPLRA